jgi:hypothetical protein
VSKLEEALEELADAQEALENIGGVSAPNAHISYSCVEYPNATVYLDVVGNVSRVEFDGDGWEATS